MARLIDAESTQNRIYVSDLVIKEMRKIPTVDAVPVVRCRECQYWQDNNGGYPHPECRWGHGETPDENDFCSYGERKDDAHEPMGT